MDLWSLYDEYELFARSSNRSVHTITSMRYHVRRFVVFLETAQLSTRCDTVTARTIRDFIVSVQQTHAPKTVSNNVVALKTIFAFAVREELLASDPTHRVATPKLPTTDFEIFSKKDIDTLLTACDRTTLMGLRDFAIVMTLFDSGIRASELVLIRDESIDWDRGLVRVLGKGAKERQVPVSARTLRSIRRYQRGRDKSAIENPPTVFLNHVGDSLTTSGLLQLLERLGKRTGLHVHPHKFRHSFAVHALRNDAREFDIQDCLGHTTLYMTKHYARQSAVDLSERHKRFSPADRLKTRS